MITALTTLLAVLSADAAAPSRCYSPYNPVAMGSEWEYRGENRSSSRDGQVSVTRSESRQRVVALDATSMRLQLAGTYTTAGQAFPSDRTADYACGDDGAVFVPETKGPSRTTYRGSQSPLRSEPGTKWDAVADSIDADGKGVRFVTHFEVVGTEKVVVPAGQFEALKVAWQQETIRVDPSPKELAKWQKIDRDTQVVTKGFRWYAPQVGLVRSSFETTVAVKGKPESATQGADELVTFRP